MCKNSENSNKFRNNQNVLQISINKYFLETFKKN